MSAPPTRRLQILPRGLGANAGVSTLWFLLISPTAGRLKTTGQDAVAKQDDHTYGRPNSEYPDGTRPPSWRESCTCPGAEQERRSLDQDGAGPPDFDEMFKEAHRRSRARKEALQATQAQFAGKSRDEIREMLVAELNARGLKKPSDTVLDAIVDRISGNPQPTARLAAESLVQVGKALHELSRRLRPGS